MCYQYIKGQIRFICNLLCIGTSHFVCSMNNNNGPSTELCGTPYSMITQMPPKQQIWVSGKLGKFLVTFLFISRYLPIYICLPKCSWPFPPRIPTLSSLTAHVRNGGSPGEVAPLVRPHAHARCSVTKALLSEILIP